MRDFSGDLAGLRQRFVDAQVYLGLGDLRDRLKELEATVSDPALWDDQDRARQVTTEFNRAKVDVDLLDGLSTKLDDADMLYQLGTEEGDDSVEQELEEIVAALARSLGDLELRSLFSGDHDEADAVIDIHAKDGGTDAQDWAEMLERMYLRWAERRGFIAEEVDRSPGEEAGILSAEIIIRGRYVYGLLSGEKGVHRLVRNSPFDSQHRRQTSFAQVTVTPFLEEATKVVDIDDKDIRIDTYRSSGAGGQHVNKTDSAIRITHFPSGIVVACQDERSQTQNKARAFQILAAKLLERQEEERRVQLAQMAGPVVQIGWGSQIRSYVISQYNLVKDLRTDVEHTNPQAVFDGDLDGFMEAYLRWRRARQ